MMKAKIIGSILITALLSSCLTNQSTSTKVLPSELPMVSVTPNVLPSETSMPNIDNPTTIANSSLTEVAAVLSATPAPYIDFPPLRETPDGGWKTYKNAQYGFSFEYPSSYDTGSCGKLIVSKSAQQFKVQFDGSTISISITNANDIDLKVYAQQWINKSEYLPLTVVDDFTIDGVPSVRFGLRRGAPLSAQYEKLALMIYQDKLYLFQYSLMNFVWCDAPPISEEGVYEHLLSTWHFSP